LATKIYLDVCCLNRPFDDQRQERVKREADAVNAVLLKSGCDFINSDVILLEVIRNADERKQTNVLKLLEKFSTHIASRDAADRAREIEKLGIAPLDALHLASAECAGADVFLTVDDRLIRKARSAGAALNVRVETPDGWLILSNIPDDD
jgi:predicted nucleic acid-binding protein